MNIDWKKLQNGSDIRGVAIAKGEEKVNLTPEIASCIGSAFAARTVETLPLQPG